MGEQFQRALKDRDLANAGICGFAAAILMSYVANVAKPGIFHVLLALLALAAILGGFLSIAHSKAEPELKGAAGIVVGLISVLCFVFLSMLY
jgi:hypothetical protein